MSVYNIFYFISTTSMKEHSVNIGCGQTKDLKNKFYNWFPILFVG